jgi:hypothetical protein
MASEAKNKNKNSKVKVILRIEAETTSFFFLTSLEKPKSYQRGPTSD